MRLASLRYLASAQRGDGGFLGVSAPRRGVAVPGAEPRTETVFGPALVASCISLYAKEPEAARIVAKAGAFLARERGANGWWGYFSGATKVALSSPYPDDLDDTSCALIALHAADPKLSGEGLARLVEALMVCEDRTGGPYHTWIFSGVRKSRWKGVDPVVNANVGSFLALNDVHVPSVAQLVDEAISSGSIETEYYEALASAYFLSRYCALRRDKDTAAAASSNKSLKRIVLARRRADGTWGDSLSNALAVSSLARLGAARAEMRRAAASIERSRAKDGSWPAAPLYREEARGGTMMYAGSRALSTAFALEALALFDDAMAREAAKAEEALEDAVCGEAARLARAEISTLPAGLRGQAEATLSAIEKKGLGKLILPLPYAFARAMTAKGDIGAESRAACARLGAANMLGWMGYTMQDDVMDGDSGPQLLPASNALLRRSLALLESEARRARRDGAAYVRRAFDRMDEANAREISGTPDRYRSAAVIGEKSLGHALGPLILAMKAGLAPKSARFKALEGFFVEYLVARQMNDDAHDWEKDLGKGQENYVAAGLMEAWRARGKKARKPSRSALKVLFWERHMDRVSAEISARAAKARRLFVRAAVASPAFAEALLAPIERAARKAVDERDKARQFIAARR